MKKQFSFLFLAVLVQFTLSFGQEDMVKLIRSENYMTNGYQCCWEEEKNVLIQIKDVDYNKLVYVHHQKSDNSWIDVPAHYLREGNSTYELWVADKADFGDTIQYGNQFVIKYVVLGQTYWDNNNGANYTLTSSSEYGPGPMLGNYINVFLKSASRYENQLSAYIDVRNIGYVKNVALTYTTDNWASSTTLQANYLSSIQTGYSTWITFPNAYTIERWGLNSTIPTVPIQFYISYTVNGQTYYDNNYWSNYFLNN